LAPEASLQHEISPKLQRELRGHAGKWVATSGDTIIAVGTTAKKVYREAKRQMIANPAIFKVPEKGRRSYFF
jgi:hypothetical protein